MIPSPASPRRARAAILPALLTALALLPALAGCGRGSEEGGSRAAAEQAPSHPVVFRDVTAAAGIRFVHDNGAFGRKYLPETMGAGLAFLDFDGDGRPDLFFVNGTDWPGHRRIRSTPTLYRNRGDGTFEDVTEKAGLAVEIYGIGVAAGDYDNDGYPDLFINALGPNRLFHNRGDGTFEDVTEKAGVSDPDFGSSATWLDYDRDGWLDLFVGNYVAWSPATDITCTLDGVTKSYCTPESYRGVTDRLFRNRHDGTFEDVTRKAGIYNPSGKSLGVVELDYNNDGWPDLVVANDTQPNYLYRNQRNGTFKEVGVAAGIALGEDGKARGAMGIDAGDEEGTGRDSLIIGNFSNEMLTLYRNQGRGIFLDEAPTAGIGEPSLLTLAFGCFFFDYDLDGRLDIFVANGHVENDINRVQPSVTYAQPPHLFRGLPGGKYKETTFQVGPDLRRPLVARGAAYADYDGDGDLDVAVSTNDGPAVLYRNDGGNADDWIRLRLVGRKSNREAIGARVMLMSGGRRQFRMVRSAASYASQSETVLTFGLGPPPAGGSRAPVEAVVTWPAGEVQRFPGLAPNRLHVLKESP